MISSSDSETAYQASRERTFLTLRAIGEASDSAEIKAIVDDVVNRRISLRDAGSSVAFTDLLSQLFQHALDNDSESAVAENVPTSTSTVTNSVAIISNSPAAPEPTPQADHVRPMFVSPDELWLASRETSK